MEYLDDKIDALIRDKMVSLLQENAVRLKKTTIKYTKSNKKHTLEHWQAIYDSHDKVFRSMPKDLLRVEREIRLKFISPVSAQRASRVRIMVQREAELLFQKLTDECRPEFEKLGKGTTFDERLEQSRNRFRESLEQSIQKCLDTVNQEAGKEAKTGIEDLISTYGVKESTLHEINIVSPLLHINSLISQVNGETGLSEILQQMQDGFRFLFQDIQKHTLNDVASKDARKQLKMQVARETMTVREIILNAQPFLEQMVLPEDRRNPDVIRKSWLKILEILEGQGDRWESVIPGFRLLYNHMSGGSG